MIFKFEKETKNTYRYQEQVEEGKQPAVGTIYTQKSHLGAVPPDEIEITIKAK